MTDQNPFPGLLKNILKPKDEEIFYHYCSMETFRLICENKTLRFSDINMLNDVAETAWGYSIFEHAATELLKNKPPGLEKLDKEFLDSVDKIVSSAQSHSHPVICSFSRAPDVLGQWRAYADNGAGVAIGFSGKALRTLPATILGVEYDEATQVREMAEALSVLYVIDDEREIKRQNEFNEMCFNISCYKHAYKNPSFSDEREVRSFHLLSVKHTDSRLWLEDEGGIIEGKESPGQKVKFRTKDGAMIGFIDIPLSLAEEPQPIKEVWLGPRNENSPFNIIYMMGVNGLDAPGIKKSKSTYRG